MGKAERDGNRGQRERAIQRWPCSFGIFAICTDSAWHLAHKSKQKLWAATAFFFFLFCSKLHN